MPKKGRVWTPEEDALMERETKAGKTDAEIGRMLGRSFNSVRMRRSRLLAIQINPKYKNGVCDMTCPDFCPYKDCKLSGAEILRREYKQKKVVK